MPYVFQDLTEEQAQAFCDAYVAGAPGRLEAFLEALKVFPATRAAVESGESGMPMVWQWFYETYGTGTEVSPLADAGVEYQPPYWWTPIEWYRVGTEGVWVASGVAVWVWSMLGARHGPLALSPDPDERNASYNSPLANGSLMPLPDAPIETSARRLVDPTRPKLMADARRPASLVHLFKILSDKLAADLVDGSDRASDELAPPEIYFDDQVTDGCVEITLDPMTDEDRQERFEALLFASPLFERSDWDGDRCHIIPKTVGARPEVEQAMTQIWDESEPS